MIQNDKKYIEKLSDAIDLIMRVSDCLEIDIVKLQEEYSISNNEKQKAKILKLIKKYDALDTKLVRKSLRSLYQVVGELIKIRDNFYKKQE